MTVFAVAFTAYLCPGTMMLLGFPVQLARLPDSAKPVLAVVGVCQARPTFELYDPARVSAARARVLALGRPAQMYAIEDGVTVGPPLVDWPTAPTFKETP